jgi:hypothetical protein
MHARQTSSGRRHGWVVVPLVVLLLSCGGDDGAAGPIPGETTAAPAGTGEAGGLGSPGGETANPTNPGGGETQATGATPSGAAPPTAGGGEAGIRTDPGGNQIIVTPECGSIDVTGLSEAGQFAELRTRLDCILRQPEAVPVDVLAAAKVADAYAAARLAEQDPSVLDPEVRAVIEQPPAELPASFEHFRDEARDVVEGVSQEQEGG